MPFDTTLTDMGISYGAEIVSDSEVEFGKNLDTNLFEETGETPLSELKMQGKMQIVEKEKNTDSHDRLIYVQLFDQEGKGVIGMSDTFEDLFGQYKNESTWVAIDTIPDNRKKDWQPEVWKKQDGSFVKMKLKSGYKYKGFEF